MVLGSWERRIHHFVLFGPENGLFKLPKHYVLKANFEAKNTIKQGKKRQKDKWYPFHACTPPPPYMHEIGTMWQIGVLTKKPCTFLVQNRSFSAFWHYKNKERLSKGLDVKWHIPSTCLDATRVWVCYWNLEHKQDFRVAVSENPTNPSKWPKCAPFLG